MTFEVFLPESMADWLRAKIAAGVFTSPEEAAFVAFQDFHELDRHPAGAGGSVFASSRICAKNCSRNSSIGIPG